MIETVALDMSHRRTDSAISAAGNENSSPRAWGMVRIARGLGRSRYQALPSETAASVRSALVCKARENKACGVFTSGIPLQGVLPGDLGVGMHAECKLTCHAPLNAVCAGCQEEARPPQGIWKKLIPNVALLVIGELCPPEDTRAATSYWGFQHSGYHLSADQHLASIVS